MGSTVDGDVVEIEKSLPSPPSNPNRIIEFQLSSHWQTTLSFYESLPLFNLKMYLSSSQAVALHGTVYVPRSECIDLGKGVKEIIMV
jgi:hypothetical protein